MSFTVPIWSVLMVSIAPLTLEGISLEELSTSAVMPVASKMVCASLPVLKITVPGPRRMLVLLIAIGYSFVASVSWYCCTKEIE